MKTQEKGAESAPGTLPKIAWTKPEKALLWGAAGSGLGLGGLGLYSSFFAMYEKAQRKASEGGWQWGESAWMLPVGVDLSILVFSIINLILIKLEKPLGWVKWVPRGGTVVTIALNWNAGATTEAQLGHAALAGLWVVLSEIAAHLYKAHIGRLRGVSQMERIRLGRWLAHPIGSFRIRLLMISSEITSYEEALERDKDLMIFRSGLRKTHGRLWRFKAGEDDLQVLRLVRYGMTVEEALDEPFRRAASDRQRDLQRDLQRDEEVLQREEAEHERELRKIERQATKERAEGERDSARERAAAETSAALQKQQLALQVEQTELQAQQQTIAAESAAKVSRLQADAAKATHEVELEDFEASLQRRRAEVEDELRRRSDEIQAEAERQAEARVAEGMKRAGELVEAARREAEGQAKAAEDRLADLAEQQRQTIEQLRTAKTSLAGDLDAVEGRRREIEDAVKAAEGRLKEAEAEAQRRLEAADKMQRLADLAETRLKAATDQAEAAREEAEALMKPSDAEVLQVALLIVERRRSGLAEPTIEELKDMFGFSQGTASGRRAQARKLAESLLVKN